MELLSQRVHMCALPGRYHVSLLRGSPSYGSPPAPSQHCARCLPVYWMEATACSPDSSFAFDCFWWFWLWSVKGESVGGSGGSLGIPSSASFLPSFLPEEGSGPTCRHAAGSFLPSVWFSPPLLLARMTKTRTSWQSSG